MRFVPSVARRRRRPPVALGLLVALGCLVAETGLGAILQRVTSVSSPGVVYVVGLVVVTSVWGLRLGALMAVASTLTLDYFFIPPRWNVDPTRHQDLMVLAIFMAMALLVCSLARLARLLSVEVEAREEADLCADLARLLLRTPHLGAALPAAGTKLARTLGLPSASIQQAAAGADHDGTDGDGTVFPLRGRGVEATLVVPGRVARPAMRRLRDRVVPSLEVLLEAAHEREQVGEALRKSRDRLAELAEEQASLRRLATLVAHAAPPPEVFQAVAREMGHMLGIRHTLVARYEPDGTTVCVGNWNDRDDVLGTMPVGARWTPERGTVTELVWRTRAPGRVDLYAGDGPFAMNLRARGLVFSVGCPIVVGRSLWGLAVAASSGSDLLPADTEQRMTQFTELAAAAIANAQSDADLRASRARVVAAADEARRRIERDLHDGTQQRLVSIGLELRMIASSLPDGDECARRRLIGTVKALEEAVIDLQELSRGLHPAALAKGGLEPGLIVLTRRCALPVELDVSLPCRPAQQVEVTAYYIVSEALTNATKHAAASRVQVGLAVRRQRLRVSVRDDGVGGADPSRGTGLLGLTDRVDALGGTFSVSSPPGEGTTLLAELPFETAD